MVKSIIHFGLTLRVLLQNDEAFIDVMRGKNCK